MNKIVCVSGYFNPLHKGHIELFHEAKKLGDTLIVIVNNDEQVKLKGSKIFQDEKERLLIISELAIVDKVVLSFDTDKTIGRTLRMVNPDIFANGGDVTELPDREKLVCEDMLIKPVFNLGQSSSKLKGR